jgi:hypothetical protein
VGPTGRILLVVQIEGTQAREVVTALAAVVGAGRCLHFREVQRRLLAKYFVLIEPCENGRSCRYRQ